MNLRAPTGPGRGPGHVAAGCRDLRPGKETSAHGHEAASVGLLASAERAEVCAAALTGVWVET
jgi:hypothetical protein